MKNFQRFNPGDPIAASRLNDLIDFSGVAQSGFPDTPGIYFGSQRVNAETSYDSNLNFLVYATENFELRTTDHATEDDVPSGLCDFVDLIRSSNTHVPQEDGRKFYVHDPVAGMMNTASKSENDVFHIVFNRQSKRWEVLSGGGSGDEYGIVIENLGRGYYTVELTEWAGTTSAGEDICDNLIDGAGGLCENDQTLPEFTEEDPTHVIVTRQTVRDAEEDRVTVTAFDPESVFVPLALWSDCRVADRGDKIGEVKIYRVTRGFQEHTIQYKERWDCCDGVWQKLGRTPVILAAKVCEEELCSDCEV